MKVGELVVARVSVVVAFQCGCVVERSSPGSPARIRLIVQCAEHAAAACAAGTCEVMFLAAESAALEAGVRTSA